MTLVRLPLNHLTISATPSNSPSTCNIGIGLMVMKKTGLEHQFSCEESVTDQYSNQVMPVMVSGYR